MVKYWLGDMGWVKHISQYSGEDIFKIKFEGSLKNSNFRKF